MTYQEAVRYLESLVNFERVRQPNKMREITLDRMRLLCQRLGNPQGSFRSILVAGTNGKGSICAMLYSMLRESSLRVGLYTSPHLEQLRERIRVGEPGPADSPRQFGDDWIDEAQFASAVEQVKAVSEDLEKLGEDPPTHFEAVTAAAFICFQQRHVELAVLEVGLGGRLDATNIVQQAVSVIGPIDIEHSEILGSTRKAIAGEKAGIIKPDQVVISAAQHDDVAEVLRAKCLEQRVPLLIYGQDLTARVDQHDLTGLQVSLTGLRGIYPIMHIPLIGRHQAENAAIAVGALEALSDAGVPHSIVETGLSKVEWPGRFEILNETPLVILDGAHNPHAAGALAEAVKELLGGKRLHLLVGVSSDKAVEDIGRALGPLVATTTCTRSRHPRAVDPKELAKRLEPFCRDIYVIGEAADALTYLYNVIDPSEAILVTGSLFLVGELRMGLRQAHLYAKSSQ